MAVVLMEKVSMESKPLIRREDVDQSNVCADIFQRLADDDAVCSTPSREQVNGRVSALLGFQC